MEKNYLNEIWKDVPGYEGLYQVSNYGRVKSMNYNHTRQERIMKIYEDKKGYCHISLMHKLFLVHRLVWEAFNGPIPERYEVNHINEDKTDNRLENLNLMTHKENINWGTCVERRSRAQINNKGKSKPVLQYTLKGRLVKKWSSVKEIERELGYDQGNISNCCLGYNKTYKGYKWRYKNDNTNIQSFAD